MEAIFTKGVEVINISGLMQWDVGQEVKISFPSMPATFQVHFGHKKAKEAYAVEAITQNGSATVQIPNILLQQSQDIIAWVYVSSGMCCETTHIINFDVEARPRPSDYAYKATDILNYATVVEKSQEIAVIAARAEVAEACNETLNSAKSYTDTEIANLVNAAPSELDTLKELADAMIEHEDVVEALNSAIGTKANQTDLTAHTDNADIHVTASDKSHWDNATDKINNLKIADVNGLKTIVDTTQRNFTQTIDLSDTSFYDENTWYPCVGSPLPTHQVYIGINASLGNSGKPSWATHEVGFSCNLEMLVKGSGYGATYAESICLHHSCRYIDYESINPCGYSQMRSSSQPIFWLRGGGKYYAHTSYDDFEWNIITTSYENGGYSVAPTTTCPGIIFEHKSIIHANLEGVASQAISLVYSMSLKTIDVDASYFYNMSTQETGNMYYDSDSKKAHIYISEMFFTTYGIDASKVLGFAFKAVSPTGNSAIDTQSNSKNFAWNPFNSLIQNNNGNFYSWIMEVDKSGASSDVSTSYTPRNFKMLYMA